MTHTILITGASSGLGLELGLAALKAGHEVIGTGRNAEKARTSNPQFEAAGGEWVSLDVTKSDVSQVVEKLVREKGIDVLVNNAGYSLLGAGEAFSDEDIYNQFNTNVFGVARVTRGALPTFRERKAGTIVNIGSMCGFKNLPTCTMYGATKYALAGYTEALAMEVAEFNIRAVLIEPGAYRTNFLTDTSSSKVQLPKGYEGTVTEQATQGLAKANWNQPGDPAKAAARMVDIITLSGDAKGLDKSWRVPLGDDCHAAWLSVAKFFTEEAEKVRKIAVGTNHADV